MAVLLFVVASLLAGIALRLFLQLKRARREGYEVAAQAAALRERVQTLSKYEGLTQVDEYVRHQQQIAQQVIDDANTQATTQRAEAGRLVAEAQNQAVEVVATARRQGQSAIAEAQAKAAEKVAAAERQAQEIAGEALEAKRSARRYEETVTAMKNVIDGYGDRYIVPTFTVLDELGEELGFTEAGQRLKESRQRVRDMIKNGSAAHCDYVEANRRDTAVRFVIDAFNGKCDTVLSDVRHDNYGTLAQKLNDAFSLVNANGEAFRNARIDPAFLQARLDELRWAVAAHEMKLKEREEQRALKERIRDEERAQREYEKARKDALKEEETIRKAMERAQREIEKATEAQKAKYEGQLAELAERLRAAEEKNQRAISMAQQTKAGHVYVISNVGSFGEHVYKIGMTRRWDPQERVDELGDASVPFEFDVHALIRSDDAPALERELQKQFVRMQVNKVNPRKEFFRVPIGEIRQVAESLGCQASWTMIAECREYRETVAMEERMKKAGPEEAAWIERQLRESQAPANDTDEAEELAS